jgi:hypothetical protein
VRDPVASRSREPNGPHDSVRSRDDRNVPIPVMRQPGAFQTAPLLLHLQIPPFPGGCEGFAMYNRTNLTLSARSLSNRLNLGTRSLALNASVNHGDQTLRTRTAHHGVMREGMVWYDVFPITQPRYGIPTIPGSPFQRRQSLPSCLTRQPGQSAEGVPVEPEPRPANLDDRPERCAEVGDPWSPAVAVALGKSTGISAKTHAARRAAKAKPGAATAAPSIGR